MDRTLKLKFGRLHKETTKPQITSQLTSLNKSEQSNPEQKTPETTVNPDASSSDNDSALQS